MREIKFRAWDKLNNQMLEVLQICFDDRGLPYLKVGIVGRNGTNQYNLKMEDVDLLQFTGLLDKNGKEIYEGDIIKFYKTKTTVIFEDGKFTADIHNKFQTTYWKACEAIGNIYKNPGLLEATR